MAAMMVVSLMLPAVRTTESIRPLPRAALWSLEVSPPRGTSDRVLRRFKAEFQVIRRGPGAARNNSAVLVDAHGRGVD